MSDIEIGFEELNLSAPVLDALRRIGYETPSPIQAQAIPPLLEGRDLLGTAQTGTGKTAAFALPILSRIDLAQNTPQALVLVPTRELAIQVAEAFQSYASHIKGFHVLPLYGGQDMRAQIRALQRGVHVIVGTPGRTLDHLSRRTLDLSRIRHIVLDEADEMLRMGFIDDVTEILKSAPAERQTALFSATMPKPIQAIIHNYLKDPVQVRIKPSTSSLANIEQSYWLAKGLNKLDALTRILEVEETDGLIIFVRTRTQTAELAEKLEARGFRSAAINGDMSQSAREKTIEQLKSGAIDILIATDVAARGIDVARVSHVINYDIPYDTEAYTHRIGRTGRAGRQGKAILFVAPRERRMLSMIERATGQKIPPMSLPSRKEVNLKRVEQFQQRITDVIDQEDTAFFTQLIETYIAETGKDPVEIAGALAFMANQGKPLVMPETPDPVGAPERERSRREPRGEGRPRSAERAPRNPRDRAAHDRDLDMVTYRIAVGRNHDVRPGDIVGAIANEAGMDSAHIGRIQLFDDYSTVDLPRGMPDGVFRHLQGVFVRGRRLGLQPMDGSMPVSRPRTGKLSLDKSRPRKGGQRSNKKYS
ncbi:DEAD/DEAH box helicase [Hahella sp. SMD15-11]|uniref:ATP-dependent RNA helicase DeaD n=1 Tax=Thermohahella caldifontis TaxID=3142973 RepID=A0AB39UV07_9GAMM